MASNDSTNYNYPHSTQYQSYPQQSNSSSYASYSILPGGQQVNMQDEMAKCGNKPAPIRPPQRCPPPNPPCTGPCPPPPCGRPMRPCGPQQPCNQPFNPPCPPPPTVVYQYQLPPPPPPPCVQSPQCSEESCERPRPCPPPPCPPVSIYCPPIESPCCDDDNDCCDCVKCHSINCSGLCQPCFQLNCCTFLWLLALILFLVFLAIWCGFFHFGSDIALKTPWNIVKGEAKFDVKPSPENPRCCPEESCTSSTCTESCTSCTSGSSSSSCPDESPVWDSEVPPSQSSGQKKAKEGVKVTKAEGSGASSKPDTQDDAGKLSPKGPFIF